MTGRQKTNLYNVKLFKDDTYSKVKNLSPVTEMGSGICHFSKYPKPITHFPCVLVKPLKKCLKYPYWATVTITNVNLRQLLVGIVPAVPSA